MSGAAQTPRVRYLDPAAAAGYPPEVAALTRFARPERPIPCAHCGEVTGRMWTMLVPFTVLDDNAQPVGPVLPALSLICDYHAVQPASPVAEALTCELPPWPWELGLPEPTDGG